jgi:hypothetical protein
MKNRTSISRDHKSSSNLRGNGYDLKYVPIRDGEERAGGWYRELPGDEIEVMSRGQLERVALNHSNPEKKAKSVVRAIVKRSHSIRH